MTTTSYNPPMYTYDTLPDGQAEWFDLFFNDLYPGSVYWLREVEIYDDHLVLHEQYEDATHTVTPDDVLETIHKHGGWFRDHRYRYYRKWIADASVGDFEHADYDSDVTDCVLQFCLFGKIIYG